MSAESRPAPNHWAKVDQEGRLVFPPELTARYCLDQDVEVRINEDANGLHLSRPTANLAKIYIEPTSQCNLNCTFCIRNAWEEPLGRMSAATFTCIIEGVRACRTPPTVTFSGFGEPLFHPQIVEMVAQAKNLGCQVELITNGTLLHPEVSQGLIDAGLDLLWVSLDGATPDSYTDVRLGAALPQVLQNIEHYHAILRAIEHCQLKIGIVFVALKRNIADLPILLRKSTQLGASHFFITNVLPYTEEMCAEVLYERALSKMGSTPSWWTPQVNLPRIDANKTTGEVLHFLERGGFSLSYNGDSAEGGMNRCPFITHGSVAVSWDGSVSPCLPLMHDHDSFYDQRLRHSRRYVIGDLAEHSLDELWNQSAYLNFRRRVQEFDFSPCTICGGCDLSEANEEDCYGNTFPTCGGCLWAQGLIQCP